MNLKQTIRKLARDSDLVYYAHIGKTIDRSKAKTHYEIPRNEIQDIGPYAKGEIDPDEKFRVRGIENLIVAGKHESGCLIIYCNREWNFLTDSWYESFEEAKKTAEMENLGIESKWKKLE